MVQRTQRLLPGGKERRLAWVSASGRLAVSACRRNNQRNPDWLLFSFFWEGRTPGRAPSRPTFPDRLQPGHKQKSVIFRIGIDAGQLPQAAFQAACDGWPFYNVKICEK